MIAADRSHQRPAKLLNVETNGSIRHLLSTDLASLFQPGDLVIANDAATLPASLSGIHVATGNPIEIRLAAWVTIRDPTHFVAIAFGPGDHRIPTEKRPPPPLFSIGDHLQLGPLVAVVEHLFDHPRLLRMRFLGGRKTLFAGLARHGRPIQYAHVPSPLALWDVWTSLAANPVAFEPPSAGFALDWRLLNAWRRRGIHFATITHAAGISSTGDPALDLQLPFDEPYNIPERTAVLIKQATRNDKRIIAIGTTVVRALESASQTNGFVRAGSGLAQGRIGSKTPLRVVDTVLTGMHQPGESHFELLKAFASEHLLNQLNNTATDQGYRSHEFGDAMLIEQQRSKKLLGFSHARQTRDLRDLYPR